MVLGVAVVALAFPGCEPEPDRDHVLDELVAFAREPSDETWASVPVADRVQLGLGDWLVETRSTHSLRDPAAWMLDVDHFRGGVGPFSSLDVLAPYEGWPLQYGEEAQKMRVAAPPAAAAGLGPARLSIQPQEPVTCLRWFAVDVFVDESGDIRAVTLDLWEP